MQEYGRGRAAIVLRKELVGEGRISLLFEVEFEKDLLEKVGKDGCVETQKFTKENHKIYFYRKNLQGK